MRTMLLVSSHVLWLAALVSIGSATPGVRRIALHTAQLNARSDAGNLTANTIQFFLDLNSTLTRYNATTLPPMAGIERPADQPLDTEGSSTGDFGTVATSRRRSIGTSSSTRRATMPQGIAAVPLTSHGPAMIGRSDFGDSVKGIPTMFDTGAWMNVVPSAICVDCVGPLRYAEEGSDTGEDLASPFPAFPGSRGRRFVDKVTVAGLEVRKASFLSLRYSNNFPVFAENTAAVIGLVSSLSSNSKSFVDALWSEGKLKRNLFSFYFGRKDEGTLSASELTLGASNPARFSGLTSTIPLSKSQLWSIPIGGIVYGNDQRLGDASGRSAAHVDTGTCLLQSNHMVLTPA